MSIETENFNQLEELFKKEKSLEKRQKITRAQINILKTVQEQFIILAQDKGYSLDSYDILEKLLEQCKGMKQLAQRVGLDETPYDKQIEQIKIRIFGKSV